MIFLSNLKAATFLFERNGIPWVIAGLFFLVSGCIPIGNKSYEELESDDLPANPTYQSDVRTIIEEKCSLCHSRAGGKDYEDISYDDYDSVIPYRGKKDKGWEGIYETAIEEKSMPPGGKERLTLREIAVLLRWRDQGFVEK